MSLDEIRARLDLGDTQMLEWLATRANLVREVARIKEAKGASLQAADREASMFARKQIQCRVLGLDFHYVAELVSLMIWHSKQIECDELGRDTFLDTKPVPPARLHAQLLELTAAEAPRYDEYCRGEDADAVSSYIDREARMDRGGGRRGAGPGARARSRLCDRADRGVPPVEVRSGTRIRRLAGHDRPCPGSVRLESGGRARGPGSGLRHTGRGRDGVARGRELRRRLGARRGPSARDRTGPSPGRHGAPLVVQPQRPRERLVLSLAGDRPLPSQSPQRHAGGLVGRVRLHHPGAGHDGGRGAPRLRIGGSGVPARGARTRPFSRSCRPSWREARALARSTMRAGSSTTTSPTPASTRGAASSRSRPGRRIDRELHGPRAEPARPALSGPLDPVRKARLAERAAAAVETRGAGCKAPSRASGLASAPRPARKRLPPRESRTRSVLHSGRAAFRSRQRAPRAEPCDSLAALRCSREVTT